MGKLNKFFQENAHFDFIFLFKSLALHYLLYNGTSY